MSDLLYFPKPYPDETFRGNILRLKDHLKLTYGAVSMSLFNQPYLSIHYSLGTELLKFISSIPKCDFFTSPDDIINRNTNFQFLRNFAGELKIANAYNRMLAVGVYDRIPLLIPKSESLKFCHLCNEFNINSYGETYWNRLHLIPTWNICPIHYCELISISTTSEVFTLPEAFNHLPASKYVANEIEREISNRIIKYAHGEIHYDVNNLKLQLEDAGVVRNERFDRDFLNQQSTFLKNVSKSYYSNTKSVKYRLYKSLMSDYWSIRKPVYYILLSLFMESFHKKHSKITNWISNDCRCGNNAKKLTLLKYAKYSPRYQVAFVRCEHCGMTTRNNLVTKTSIIVDYGFALHERVKELIKSGLGPKQIQAQLSIKEHAYYLILGRTPDRPFSQELDAKLLRYQNAYLKQQDKGRISNKVKLFLQRHAPKWVEIHAQKKTRKGRTPEDNEEIDRKLLKYLKHELPIALTRKRKLSRKGLLGEFRPLEHKIYKGVLPKAKSFLTANVESPYDYCKRLIRILLVTEKKPKKRISDLSPSYFYNLTVTKRPYLNKKEREQLFEYVDLMYKKLWLKL